MSKEIQLACVKRGKMCGNRCHFLAERTAQLWTTIANADYFRHSNEHCSVHAYRRGTCLP